MIPYCMSMTGIARMVAMPKTSRNAPAVTSPGFIDRFSKLSFKISVPELTHHKVLLVNSLILKAKCTTEH